MAELYVLTITNSIYYRGQRFDCAQRCPLRKVIIVIISDRFQKLILSGRERFLGVNRPQIII